MLGKRSSQKSAKTRFLYSHENRDQQMGEEKSAKQFFQIHTNSANKKYWEKNRLKTVRKHVFYIHTNIVTKKWGNKTCETIFPETHSASKKCWEKNHRKKVRKTFFYIHTNIVTKKWGEQNARNISSSKTLIVRAKNVGEKIVGKKCEKRFFIFPRIS